MENLFSKLIVHQDFFKSIDELRSRNISLGQLGAKTYDMENEVDLEFGKYTIDGITDVKAIALDPNDGEFINKTFKNIISYDESIISFSGLEGQGVLTSHTLIHLSEDDYIPTSFIVFHFYTRSEVLASNNTTIRRTENVNESINSDYSKERNEFLIKNTSKESIILIDGPLLGKNMSYQTVKLSDELNANNVIPIFIVKNSFSNLVINSLPGLKSKYNSDLHWASEFLKNGQRTNFFLYRDVNNPDFAKYFCYIKSYNKSPQRIELHTNPYNKNKSKIESIMNLIYYYFLVNGNGMNQQVRPIAIAEEFARKTLYLFDLKKIMEYTGITPTVNEERF